MPEKLIRDRLVSRIPAGELRIADPSELPSLLARKLDEEVSELAASAYSDILEYADVLEVLMSLAERHGVSWKDVLAARQRKVDERGSFQDGLVWSGER